MLERRVSIRGCNFHQRDKRKPSTSALRIKTQDDFEIYRGGVRWRMRGEEFVVLRGYLQEADGHQGQTVGADSPREDLVQVSLQQELLQDEDQRWQDGVFLQHTDTRQSKKHRAHKL